MFTEPSTKIQEFVKKELNVLPAFHLSKKSRAFVKKIQDMVAMTPPPKYKIIKSSSSFPRGLMFNSLQIPSIKTHIINLTKKTTEIELIVGNRIYYLYFVLPHDSSIDIAESVDKINKWLSFATRFAENNCSTTVRVYLYLTNFEKRLPATFGHSIDEEHVNTAFTTGCDTSTEIIIFRREEWFKVFIHESMHNLGLDFDFSGKSQQLLKSIFPLANSNCLLRETYCEMWAEIMNILIFSNDIERHIQIERKFSLFQVAKILDHFDLNYVELFEKTAEAERLRQTNYKESTEAFCYYIIKAILLFNCNDFIEWVDANCGGTIKFDTRLIDKFIGELIIPAHNQIKLINTIDKIQTKHFDKPLRNIFLRNTLRMSVIEYLL